MRDLRPVARRSTPCAVALLIACVGARPPAPPSPVVTTREAPAPTIDLVALQTQVATRNFRLGTPLQMKVTRDGQAVLFLRSGSRDPKQSLYETSLKTGETKLLLSPEALGSGGEVLSPEEKARRERLRISTTGFTSFELSADDRSVLVTTSGRLYVVRRATGAFHELPTGAGSAFDPHFSPNGHLVAYVRDNDVYRIATEPSGDKASEIAVTHGGTELVPNGMAEFIAAEELDRARGFWWSPDGARILYETYDATKVEQLTIADPAHPESAPQRSPYPRAGRTNAEVRLSIARTDGKALAKDASKPIAVEWERAKYPYVASVTWSKGAPPTILVLDRPQTDAVLLEIDPATGKTKPLLQEHDDAWIDVEPDMPRWLTDGSGFLWMTRPAGEAPRLELRDAHGALVTARIDGDRGCRGIVDLDDAKKTTLFFGGHDSTEQRLYRASLSGGPIEDLTPAGLWIARATMAENHRTIALATSSLDAKRAFVLRDLGTTSEVVLPSVAEEPPTPVRIELTTAAPEKLRVAIVRPHGFDPSRTYPLIDAAYGGPGVNVVSGDGLSYLRAQWLADSAGAIVVAIDARGTPNRDLAFERAMKNGFAHVPLDGHVAAIGDLRARADLHLGDVGVMGWSFGGYFSALAVLRRPDVYRVAFVGAPVADWRDYDTAYTERYLGMPDDNRAVYDDASLLTWAARPVTSAAPARPLLLVHGTADDNVYFLHSLKLADALGRAGRPFELLPLTGVTHQLADPTLAAVVWKRAAEFLRAGLVRAAE